MSWSMNNISFRMAGSGSWQNLLPDEPAMQLYGKIYPTGISLADIDKRLHPLFNTWAKGNIIKIDKGKAIPIGPVITDNDLVILDPWIKDISHTMCTAVEKHLTEYHNQAQKIANKGLYNRKKFENILTIQICAHTLDSWVFSLLRKEVMGTYSPRDFAGTFFFWGYGFSSGAKRIFGFTTYGGSRWVQVHVLRSHGLDRENLKSVLRRYGTMDLIEQLYLNNQEIPYRQRSKLTPSITNIQLTLESLRKLKIAEPDDPPLLAIPVFMEKDMIEAANLYQSVTRIIFDRFLSNMENLKEQAAVCSFSQCTWSDVLCMLFHLSYSYAADILVGKGVIPEFPQRAGGEWGVWIH